MNQDASRAYEQHRSFAAKLHGKVVIRVSDLRTVQLQLLSEAIELSQRLIISTDCPSMLNVERQRIQMFEDASELLLCEMEDASSETSIMVGQALRRAYDLYSASMAKRDMAFQHASYGAFGPTRHFDENHH